MKWSDIFTIGTWKVKAMKRAIEINSLTKRIKELVISRDKIKTKNKELRDKNEELGARIKELEYELKKN